MGWRPFADSWIARCKTRDLRASLLSLFDRYVDPALDFVYKYCKSVLSLPAVNTVQTVCHILEGLLPNDEDIATSVLASPGAVRTPAYDQKLLEAHFIFACVWGIGGSLQVDRTMDYRAEFAKWWITRHKASSVPFPAGGTIFDYFVDAARVQGAAPGKFSIWAPWSQMLAQTNPAEYSNGDNAEPSSFFLPTVETVPLQFLLQLLLKNGHHAMLVGGAGTGKTVLIKEVLRQFDPELCELGNFMYW